MVLVWAGTQRAGGECANDTQVIDCKEGVIKMPGTGHLRVHKDGLFFRKSRIFS